MDHFRRPFPEPVLQMVRQVRIQQYRPVFPVLRFLIENADAVDNGVEALPVQERVKLRKIRRVEQYGISGSVFFCAPGLPPHMYLSSSR